MSDLTLTDLTIRNGTVSARISGSTTPPRLALVMEGTSLAVPETVTEGTEWRMTAALPMEALSEGARVLSVVDQDSDQVLAHLPVTLGEAYANDLRAEVEMLRAEVDLLKQAVRRQHREAD